jgi:hypothetical protein
VEDENKTPSAVNTGNKEINPVSAEELDDNTAINTQNINVGSGDETSSDPKILSSNEGVNDDIVDAVSSSLSSVGLTENSTEHKG